MTLAILAVLALFFALSITNTILWVAAAVILLLLIMRRKGRKTNTTR